MTWRELERYAISKGWQFRKHKKKHDVYVNGSRTILIERHWSQEIKVGLCFSLLKTIDVNE